MIIDDERMLVLHVSMIMRMPVRLVAFPADVLVVMMFAMHMFVLVLDFVMDMQELWMVTRLPQHRSGDRERNDTACQHPGRQLDADARTKLPGQWVKNEPAGMGQRKLC